MDETESFSDIDEADLCFILTILHDSLQKLTNTHVRQQELDAMLQRVQSARQYYKGKKQGLTNKLYPAWSEIECDTPDYIFRRVSNE